MIEIINPILKRPSEYENTPGMPEYLPEVSQYKTRSFYPGPKSSPFNTLKGGGWWMTHQQIERYLGYKLRNYQKEILDCDAHLIVVVWPRRAGKGIATMWKVFRHAWAFPGTYYILYPTTDGARKAVLYGTTAEGDRTFDRVIPPQFIDPSYCPSSMSVPLTNGSIITFKGCEYKAGSRLVGGNFNMAVFAEFAQVKDGITIYREQVAPALRLTKGQIIFESAYYGSESNIGEMWKIARDNKDVINPRTGKLLFHDSAITMRDFASLEEEWDNAFQCKDDIALWERTYYNKDSISIRHKAYGVFLEGINTKSNLADPSLPLFTAWDLGRGCYTAIWFFQVIPRPDLPKGRLIRFINYLEAREVRSKSEYISTPVMVGKVKKFAEYFSDSFHYMPHDSDNHIIDRFYTPIQIAQGMGLDVLLIPRQTRLDESIKRVCEFLVTEEIEWDERCLPGLKRLLQYEYKVNRYGERENAMVENESRDGADSFRYSVDAFFVPGFDPLTLIEKKRKRLAQAKKNKRDLQFEYKLTSLGLQSVSKKQFQDY